MRRARFSIIGMVLAMLLTVPQLADAKPVPRPDYNGPTKLPDAVLYAHIFDLQKMPNGVAPTA